MPCIQLATNQALSGEKQKVLKTRFGQAIQILPGKSEKWLMCIFCPTNGMWFEGEQSELAFLEVGLFGQPDKCEKNF